MKLIQKIFHTIGKLQISLLLFILYVIVVIPLGKLEKLISRRQPTSGWQPFAEPYESVKDLKQP